MLRLAALLYSIIATACAGTAVIGVLSAGYVSAAAIIAAAALGALVAVPIAWATARHLTAVSGSRG